MGDMTEDFRVALVEQSALLKSAVAERDALKSDVARADRRAEELRSALLRIATYFKCRHEAEAVIEKYDAALKREEALRARVAALEGMLRAWRCHKDGADERRHLDVMWDEALSLDAPCHHDNWVGDEGPVSKLGRMPRRWRCTECGFVRTEEAERQPPERPGP